MRHKEEIRERVYYVIMNTSRFQSIKADNIMHYKELPPAAQPTPIIQAIIDSRPPKEIAELLINGADPNEQDAAGNTPLFYASYRGSDASQIIMTLLAHGADPRIDNHRGFLPEDRYGFNRFDEHFDTRILELPSSFFDEYGNPQEDPAILFEDREITMSLMRLAFCLFIYLTPIISQLTLNKTSTSTGKVTREQTDRLFKFAFFFFPGATAFLGLCSFYWFRIDAVTLKTFFIMYAICLAGSLSFYIVILRNVNRVILNLRLEGKSFFNLDLQDPEIPDILKCTIFRYSELTDIVLLMGWTALIGAGMVGALSGV